MWTSAQAGIRFLGYHRPDGLSSEGHGREVVDLSGFGRVVLRSVKSVMPEWVFRYFLQGKSVEDIIDSSRDPKPTSEEVRRMINEEREKF